LPTERRIGRRSVALGWIAAVALLAPTAASAYRPFDGTDADVAEAKTVEVEVAPAELLSQEGSHAFRAPSLALSFGLGDGYELGLDGANVVTPHPEPGEPRLQFIDAAMSVKKLLRGGTLQEKHGPSVAAEFELEFPGRGQAHLGSELRGILSTAGPPGVVHLQAALERTPEGTDATTGAFIIETAQHSGLHGAMELGVEAERAGPPVQSALLALIFVAHEGLSLDVGVDFSRSGDSHATELRAGFTRQIGAAATERVRNWAKFHLRRR